MKKITAVIILVVVGFLASILIHWLAGFIAGFLILWLGKFGRDTWWMGLVAFGVMWGGYAFVQNQANDGMLSRQIGELFGGIGSLELVLLTALLGGAGGILIGWTASAITAGTK